MAAAAGSSSTPWPPRLLASMPPLSCLHQLGRALQDHLEVISTLISGTFAPRQQTGKPLSRSLSASCPRLPCFASLSTSSPSPPLSQHLFDIALSPNEVSKTLEGVPVYTVSNAGNEFVLISDPSGSKSLSLLCFRREDAESLLSQVRDREPVLRREAKVVTVPLDKIYRLNAEGIGFRFLPDPLQVKNAIETKLKAGDKSRVFDGVPVFQSESLILRSSNRRCIPIFFRKEDLEKVLAKLLRQRRRSSSRTSINIQVGSFEDVLKKLELNDESSGWGDFIFVPPGKDATQHLRRALA